MQIQILKGGDQEECMHTNRIMYTILNMIKI